MQLQHLAEVHPFIQTLHEWNKEGIEVDCGDDWEWSTIGSSSQGTPSHGMHGGIVTII